MIEPSSVPVPETLHVLTLTPFYPSEGDEARGCFIAEVLPFLNKSRMQQTVFAVEPFYRDRRSHSRSAIRARWRRFFAIPGPLGLASAGLFLFARLLPEIRRIHKTNAIHLIHAHSALPCGHAAALLARELKIPFVATVHGLDAYSTKQVGGRAGQWCERVSRMVFHSACRVICVSERVREEVLRNARKPVKTAVVYNGVDPAMFAPLPAGSESETILSVGTLIPSKGHELLIRGIAAIADKFPRLSCHIIGEGAERVRLETLSAQLRLDGRVLFLGRQNRSEVAEAMRNCTIFALTSTYEALGCVYLEAMSSQKPVIACRGQGIEEIIEQGCNGWLIEPGSLGEMTQALSGLLEDRALRRNLGTRARQTILHGFTSEHQAARLADIYRECVQ